MTKKLIKFAASITVMSLALALALPAGAFYLYVPQSLQNYKSALAQYNGPMQPPSGGQYVPPPSGQYGMPSSGGMQNPPMNQQPMYQQPTDQQQMNQQPMNQQPMYQQPTDQQQMNQQPMNSQYGPNQGQMGPNEEQMNQQQKQNNERQLQDIKRGGRQMESSIKQFETMLKNAEKKGTVVPQDIKDKLVLAKQIIEKIKAATSMEEMAATTITEAGENQLETLQEIIQSLDQARQDIFEAAQRLDGLKRGIKGMEQGLKMFEKQIKALQKSGVPIAQAIYDDMGKLRAIVDAVKKAKTWDEAEAAGVEDMQDLMENLDQSRQQLEMLSRWPQTLKQVNSELKRLASELKKSKTIVTRLAKKDIDLSSVYATFEDAVNKLTTVRNDAVLKIQAGDSQAAFDLIENDFFGQMDDIMENERIIMTMSNLGRFTSDFKQGVNMAKKQLNSLKKKGEDVAELQDLLAQATAKGNEVLDLMKAKPIDEEAILSGLQELEDLRGEFDNALQELTGNAGGGPMPWEQGKQQFQSMQMPSGMSQYLPVKQTIPQQGQQMEPGMGSEGMGAGGANMQTCNINGVEYPGRCEDLQSGQQMAP